MSLTTDIQTVEITIEGAQKLVEERDALVRLTANPDYKRIFLDKFFVEEAARYVQQSVSDNLDPEHRAAALAMAQSTGYVRQYLNKIMVFGEQAANTVAEHREYLDQLRAQDGTQG